ncbi:hypothetical protein CROQUDRAFT_54429, partial [Cronartium quercuum f. sp. fusiforme G11]
WLALHAKTGKPFQDLANYLKCGHHHCFNDAKLLDLEEIVAHNPGMYLVEIQKKMLDITGKEVSVETIQNDLHTRLGLSLMQT